MAKQSTDALLLQIEGLSNRLAEAEQLIEAIKEGEVDAFAIAADNKVYTLQSGDYAYRVLIEEFGEGALNVTEDGLIVYTNRCFCELVKLPYDKVIGSNIFDYLHTGSAAIFAGLFSNALLGKSRGEITLWIDGHALPVYISLTSLRPNLATVGIIVTDFTEKKKNEAVIQQYQKNLEAKNTALQQSNAELASFAYIASHDLQEPLRKIQTFCYRIMEKDYEDFTEGAKNYFTRITAAALRMQNLIAALLNYSRLNKTETAALKTDLNLLLADVKQSLAEVIEENNAVIVAAPLPVIKVVPYQAMQLFSNIILNAIKYRKPGVAPHITITAGIVEASAIKLNERPEYNSYREIKIADNGIGFDPSFADKIFELFQRLHGKNEYEGTGIGLAVCRKIVQNHQGYIMADAKPGVGAVFFIYLPLILEG